MRQIEVIDDGTEKQSYVTNKKVWRLNSAGTQFLFTGTPVIEYQRDEDGVLETDAYGQPLAATYIDAEGKTRIKHGPILMRWDPKAFLVQTDTYTSYRGGWVASGGSGMRPHSHVSANEGYIVTNGIY